MALHEAARLGQLQRVKQLLAQGAAANEADGQGRTPLYVSAGRGHHAVVQLLLAAQGTNVSAKAAGVWDWTPLHAAAEKGHSEVVQLLLAAGAKVDAADTHGRTPLHAAALYRHHKVVQLLLAAGAKVNADERGWTPLHYAAEEGPSENCREVVQALLAARANVNAADSDGWTPLHRAASNGQCVVVQALLAAGAKCNVADPDGWTPLHVAVVNRHPRIVQQLLAAGANANAAAAGSDTPLHEALKFDCGDQSEVVALLLRHGANPRLRDNSNRTALSYAAAAGHTAIVQLLLEAWGQPQVPAADLVAAAEAAARQWDSNGMSTFARLAKELQKLYPGELRQLLQGQYSVTAVKAATAMAAAWVADVSSLDEQRAAVRRREEDVAQEKAAVQQLILAVAGMAKAARGQLEERPNKKRKRDLEQQGQLEETPNKKQKRNPEPKT